MATDYAYDSFEGSSSSSSNTSCHSLSHGVS